MTTKTVRSLAPTRKWWATQVTAASAWLVAAINAGWDIEPSLQIMAVGIIGQAVIGYVLPNVSAPGGVPRRLRRRSSWSRRKRRVRPD